MICHFTILWLLLLILKKTGNTLTPFIKFQWLTYFALAQCLDWEEFTESQILIHLPTQWLSNRNVTDIYFYLSHDLWLCQWPFCKVNFSAMTFLSILSLCDIVHADFDFHPILLGWVFRSCAWTSTSFAMITTSFSDHTRITKLSRLASYNQSFLMKKQFKYDVQSM